jgi:hypothetical protein
LSVEQLNWIGVRSFEFNPFIKGDPSIFTPLLAAFVQFGWNEKLLGRGRL